MKHTHDIRKSVVLLASVAALVAPTAATAYPVIGDDPVSAQSQTEEHAWYLAMLQKRLASRTKPVSKPALVCQGKTICLKP